MEETAVHSIQAFDFDSLRDGLEDGRICGVRVPRAKARAFLSLLEHLGWEPDARALTAALPHYPEHFELEDVAATLDRLGFKCEVAAPKQESQGQFAASSGLLMSSDGSWSLFTAQEQAFDAWSDKSDAVKYLQVADRKALSNLRNRMRPSSSVLTDIFWDALPELRLVFVITMLSAGLAICAALGIVLVFDAVLPTYNPTTLYFVLAGLVVVLSVDLCMRYLRARAIGRVSAGFVDKIGARLFEKLLAMKSDLVANAPLGAQMSRLRQFEMLRDLPGSGLARAAFELPTALALLVVIAILAWQVAAVLFVHAVALLALAVLLLPQLVRSSQNLSRAQANLSHLTAELLGHRVHIARYDMTDAMMARVGPVLTELASARERQARSLRVVNALAYVAAPSAAVLVITTGAVLVVNGLMSAGELLACTVLAWRFGAPVQQIIGNLQALKSLQQITRQVEQMLNLPEEDKQQILRAEDKRNSDLEVRSVSLRFQGMNYPLLAQSSFEIKAGSFVTLTGMSGVGKSSVLKLLAGLQEPQSGSVRFGGINLTQYSVQERTGRIVYVPQAPLMFFGTVAQNLRFADPLASDAQLAELTQELGLGPWLDSLPNGLETRLDPTRDGALLRSATRLSLAVCQAYLRRPDVVLIDEAAGGMTHHESQSLMDAIKRRRGTLTQVLVTHRPALMRAADASLVISKRQVSKLNLDRKPAHPLEKSA